CQQHHSYPHSF
nr:immunoglobulin light chain junction region [Macaca mulatta]MOX54911.1 immunoglobulin light chain junction region [Macaca mulatta]MOX55178.1 immunoglobulin light chain junction region [Macaca mulatta]MOX57210.1 immunoglobulin light chain junction region [Macaca mulatta]MOX57441.1 immunoglobulin light chain junction region [Macaca mulatta]